MTLVVKYGTDTEIMKDVERFRALSKTEREHEANKRQMPDGREAVSIESKRRFGTGGDGGPGSQWKTGPAQRRSRATVHGRAQCLDLQRLNEATVHG